jgi:hypothetical protein
MSPLQKYTVTDKNVMPWTEKYPTVLNYLSKINSYRERAATDLYLYCEWAEKNPDELLAMKSSFENLEAEKLLDKFVYTKLKFPETRKWQITMKVRGFYRANYRSLASSAGKMEYPPPKAQRVLSKEKRRKFFGNCYSPRDEALVMAASCTALALETLSLLRWYHFEENWEQQEIPHISVPPELLKGHGKGKYRGVRQETFLTPEAKTIFIKYREWFSKTFKHKWTEDDYVFLSTKRNIGEPITRNVMAVRMKRLSERSGVSWSIHDGRRIVQTALENVSTSSNWIKKVKGRKVSGEEAPYSKPLIEQLRAKYRLALEDLEFLHEKSPVVDEKKLRSQMLLDLAKVSGFGSEQLKKLEDALQRAKDPDLAIEEFRKLKDNAESQRLQKTPKQQPKHIIVKGDAELLKKLDDGYSLVESLDEDKFLMKL